MLVVVVMVMMRVYVVML